MTSWTHNDHVKKRLEKKWSMGHFLAQSVSDTPFEPLRIPLKHPTANELTHGFDEARKWIDHLIRHAGKGKKRGYDIEWRLINHRTLGQNRLPVAVIFPSLNDIVSYLNKKKEMQRFQTLYKKITELYPEFKDLLGKRPNDVLRHDGVWDRLLAIVAHMKAHHRPMIYIRQLEIPGVDTKFIETHKAFLDRLLCACLPEDAVDRKAKGKACFEKRFGLLAKPARIRFRILDPSLSIMGFTDLEIPACDFRKIANKPDHVFIVENEINGLSFPEITKAMAVFGLGYGLAALADIDWLKQATLWYWGDMDTHGFAMLNQIRHYFSHTRSFLMDEKTLLSHKNLWGSEPSPTHRDLPLLTDDEKKVYDALRNNELASSLRLEQERISFSRVKRALTNVSNR